MTKKQAAVKMGSMRTLAQILYDWRTERGLTQDAASRICGLSYSQWSRLESGERIQLRRGTFRKISDGTGILLSVLMGAAALSLASEMMAGPAAERGVTVSPERSGDASGESGEWTPTTKPTKRKSLSPTSP